MSTKKKTTKKSKPKAAPDVKTPDVDGKALLDFLAKRAGGVDKATKAFIRDTTAALVKSGATFGAIVAQAGIEGWGEVLAATPVKSVLAAPAKSSPVNKGRKGDLAKLRTNILDALTNGPPTGFTAAVMATALGADRKRLTRQLVKLAEDGKVKTAGSKRNRTYSLA